VAIITLETTKSGRKIWLTDTAFGQLQRSHVAQRDDLIVQLGGRVSLRGFETSRVSLNHVRRSDSDHYRLRGPEGNKTSGSGGKPWNACLPERVACAPFQYQRRDSRQDAQSSVDPNARYDQAAVNRSGEATASHAGDAKL
jgi:hypothetical protein